MGIEEMPIYAVNSKILCHVTLILLLIVWIMHIKFDGANKKLNEFGYVDFYFLRKT